MIQCPFDPKHLIRKEMLNRHIKVCDKRPEKHPCYGLPFFEPQCNVVPSLFPSKSQISDITLQ